MFLCRPTGFIYRDEGSELAKSFFNIVDCLDAFDLQGEYRIGKAFFGNCWLVTIWDECMKMRNALIN